MNNVIIVIVTYNSATHIDRCLKSIALFPFENIRYSIVVYDNNSQDNTREIVGIRDKVTYIQGKKNVGFAAAVNKVVRITKSEYILLLNPDTQVLRNSLNLLLHSLIIENADISGGKMVRNDNQVHRTYVRRPDLMIALFDLTNLYKLVPRNRWHRKFYYIDEKLDIKKSPTIVDAVSGGYMLVRRDTFISVGGFDKHYFMYLEDVDFCVRAGGRGARIIYCPQSVIWHEGGGSSPNKTKTNYGAWISSRRYYYHKNCHIYVNIVVQPIFILDHIITSIWRLTNKT